MTQCNGAKGKKMRLGDELLVEHEKTVGIRYLDGGYGISDLTPEGRLLHTAGIYYVCQHGRACGNRQRRYTWCPECDHEMQGRHERQENPEGAAVGMKEMPFVYSAYNGHHPVPTGTDYR